MFFARCSAYEKANDNNGSAFQGWMGRIYNIDGATTNVPTNLNQRNPDVAVVLAALDYDDAGFKAIGAPDDNFAAVFEGMLQVWL